MIEFVMSRVGMAFAALAITAVLISAFNGMDRDAMRQAGADRAEGFAELVGGMGENNAPGEITLEGRDVLIAVSDTLDLRSGSMWLSQGGIHRAMEFPEGVVLYEKGRTVDALTLHYDDVIRVRSVPLVTGGVRVQVEKVDATAFTASTNFLHSSSVL